MRKSLAASFGDDNLRRFKMPGAARKISESIDKASAEFEERIRKISDSSDEPIRREPDRISRYIDYRQEFVEDFETHLKETRNVLRTESSSTIPKSERRKAMAEVDEVNKTLLKERAILAADRIRVKFDALSYPSHVRVGDAYMMALSPNLPEPADSAYKKHHGRSSIDQTSFRKRLVKAYVADIPDTYEDPLYQDGWCPVLHQTFSMGDIKAAYIVPYCTGEENAAYMFGVPLREGYETVWTERNGLLLHHVIEEIFDDGRLVILPDPTDPNEFVSLVLSQELLESIHVLRYNSMPLSIIHKRRLQFQTTARPEKRYLYMHALLTLFRRRRYDVPGWEKDRHQVFGVEIGHHQANGPGGAW
jgi:hypothetical protein